ncbi:MAG: helix-turn-helix transcriptional regulator [Bacteroides sp]|nr:helix-turn-helix transcriptional regulator [Bacteroides sp.]
MNSRIQHITIDELQNHLPESLNAICKEGYFIASHCGVIDKQIMEIFMSSVRMATTFFVLCKDGEVDITYNQKHYVLKKNSLIVGIPDIVVQINSQSLIDANAMFCKKEFLDGLNVNVDKSLIHILLYILNNPILELTAEELSDLQHTFMDLEKFAKTNEEDFFTKEIIASGIRAFIYKVCRIVSCRIKQSEYPRVNTRKYDYFKRFFALLATGYKQHRNVNWYAEQLHLSTKYFTSLIRQVSGRTTVDWINDRVIYEAKNLLLYSEMSITEIAYQLNFPSTSFFSKYFKNIVGINPSEFRKV